MMKRALAIVAGVVALAAGGLAAAYFLTRQPELARTSERPSFGRKTVSQGEVLAGLGGCATCHTAEGGAPFAGGRAIETPFGVLYASNITPHPESGIGGWSREAFARAMRRGVSRTGALLYPAFPYDHFTRASDEDIDALYAYFMQGVQPEPARPPANAMAFPFNIREGLALWNALFLKPGPGAAEPGKDEEWSRGAYLAQGLGHCGACHSPRNQLGAVDASRAYSGALVNGWYAPALNAQSPAPAPWTKASLANYLTDGWDKAHGIAAGSMTPVVDALRELPEDDVFAVAAYVASLDTRSEAEKAELARKAQAFAEQAEWDPQGRDAKPSDDPGARVFQARCAECHRAGGRSVPLGLNSPLNQPDPTNVVRVVFAGIKPPRGALGKSMPALGAQMSDQEAAALVRFLRARFTTREAWTDVEEVIGRERARRP
ncbi:MAG TPA: cytochrome c [Beijerinckiaceae bacterium]|jgi:nicotinate dehydrogenase subunit B